MRLIHFFLIVPTVCNVIRDLKDSTGNYLKTLCSVYKDQTYDEAVKTCAASGMKMYNADQTEAENALLTFSDLQWPLGTFWVEGKSGSNCSAVSNTNIVYFAKTSLACPSNAKNYFHCEYQCKLHFLHMD